MMAALVQPKHVATSPAATTKQEKSDWRGRQNTSSDMILNEKKYMITNTITCNFYTVGI
jgi:hypothetical protein